MAIVVPTLAGAHERPAPRTRRRWSALLNQRPGGSQSGPADRGMLGGRPLSGGTPYRGVTVERTIAINTTLDRTPDAHRECLGEIRRACASVPHKYSVMT